jgi:hypothetical protein
VPERAGANEPEPGVVLAGSASGQGAAAERT